MTNVAAVLIPIAEEEFINYFKSRNALTPTTAIALDLKELKNQLELPEFLEQDIKRYKFIKQMPDGRYYLDQSILNEQTKKVKSVINLFIILLLSILLITLFVS